MQQEAVRRDSQKWSQEQNTYNILVGPRMAREFLGDWESSVRSMKSWLHERAAWMDRHLGPKWSPGELTLTDKLIFLQSAV